MEVAHSKHTLLVAPRVGLKKKRENTQEQAPKRILSKVANFFYNAFTKQPTPQIQTTFTELDDDDDDDAESRMHCLFPPKISQDVQLAVRKLFDGNEFVGTFIYLHKCIGCTAFHSVVEGKLVKQDSLTVDTYNLQHLVSFPFYDVSFYRVLNRDTDVHLALGEHNNLFPTSQVFLASYPDYSANEPSVDEEVEMAAGNICRLALPGTPFVAAHYSCSKGSSGGAVLSRLGKVVGMHVENWFYESGYSTRWGAREFTLYKGSLKRLIREEERISYPSLTWNQGVRKAQEMHKFNNVDTTTVARYAAVNVPNKSATAAFLPVYHLRLRLESAKTILEREVLGLEDEVMD